MLEEIAEGGARGRTPPRGRSGCGTGPRRCERLIVLSDTQVDRAEQLLGVDQERCVRVSNGFDPQLFAPGEVDRAAHWRRHLVEEPLGWRPGEEAGSVRYEERELEAFGDSVLLYVGRFTAVKRVGLLIEAYARARPDFERPAPLVLVGRLSGRVGGRAPRRGDRAHRRPRTSSSPAGTATTSCRTSSTRPTCSCCRRCASSSARCSWRGWPAGCPRSRSTPTARPRSSSTARPAGWSSPTTSTGSPTRWSRRSTAPRSAAGAASGPARSRSSATPGPRWRRRSPRSTTPPWLGERAGASGADLRRCQPTSSPESSTACPYSPARTAATFPRSASGPPPAHREHAMHRRTARPTQSGRPVRPHLRARCLRRRHGRPAQRRAHARDGPAGDRRAREPRAPRRRGRRPEHRRRRRDAHAAPRRAAACGHRRGPAAARRLRRRRLLPAPGGGAPRRARGAADRDRRGRGPARRRLARRAGRQGLRRHHRQLLRALHQAARGRGRRRRTASTTRTPSSASST